MLLVLNVAMLCAHNPWVFVLIVWVSTVCKCKNAGHKKTGTNTYFIKRQWACLDGVVRLVRIG
jgi:hypothetical protein